MTAGTNKTATGPRVLVVDDNQDAALILSMILKLKGYAVQTCNSGHQALQMAAIQPPQVILLDISMPEMDGFETCRRIRQQPGGQNVVVIALTGYGQEEDRQRTQKAGFDGHLVKPVELAALLELMTNLLDSRKTNQQSN